MNQDIIRDRIRESIKVKEDILSSGEIIDTVSAMADAIAESIMSGGKLLTCGNGGSASDALHIAGEILGRFQKERRGYAAVALNADVATMTAIANDYGYEEVFARQAEGIMKPEDIILGISTSGNSGNIVRAFEKAHEIGGRTALLSGKDGGKLKAMSDFCIIVPSGVTARIQEGHIVIYHILCELIENKLMGQEN